MPGPADDDRRRRSKTRTPGASTPQPLAPPKRAGLNLSLPPDLVDDLYRLASYRGHRGRVSRFLEPHLRALTEGVIHYERKAAGSVQAGKGTDPAVVPMRPAPQDQDEPTAA